MTYSVSQQFYFREIRRSVPAGGTVYLDDEVAQKYLKSHPGLLKPTRQTTQGAPKAVRSKPKPEETPAHSPAEPKPEEAPKPERRKKSA